MARLEEAARIAAEREEAVLATAREEALKTTGSRQCCLLEVLRVQQ